MGVLLRIACSAEVGEAFKVRRVKRSRTAGSFKQHSEESSTYLLDSSNVPSDVLDRDGILHGQAVRLALDPRFVDENTTIRSQA